MNPKLEVSQINFPASFLFTNTAWIELSSEKDPPFFHLGETLEGEVIKQVDDRHAVVRFKGQDLLVESNIALPKEKLCFFKVEAVYPRIFLRHLSEEGTISPSSLPLFRSLLPSNVRMDAFLNELSKLRSESLPPPVRNTVERLADLLGRFSMDPSVSPDPKQAQEIVLRSGIFFEKRLRNLMEGRKEDQADHLVAGDLKGLVMKLRAQLTSLGVSGEKQNHFLNPPINFEKNLEQIFQKIKGYQTLNIDSPHHQGRMFFLLPLIVQNEFQFIEMHLSLPHPQAGSSGRGGVSLFFLLHMPEWGRLCIDVRMREKGIYCRFVVSDPEVSAFINKGFPDLITKLNGMGFTPHLSVSVETNEKIVQEWWSEVEREGESLLNLVI